MQRTATYILQHTATYCSTLTCQGDDILVNALQHTATYCSLLQRTATHTMQHTATHILQHTATYCSTLTCQRDDILVNALQHTATCCSLLERTATHTMQHTATDCNILQNTDVSKRRYSCKKDSNSFFVGKRPVFDMKETCVRENKRDMKETCVNMCS